MKRYLMSINGEQTDATEHFSVINPATEEYFAEAPRCSQELLEAAIDGGQKAFGDWQGDEEVRRSALAEASDKLEAASEEIAYTLTLEQGKPLLQSRMELERAVMRLRNYARMPIPNEVTDDKEDYIEIHYRPHGLVAGITPWNFPIQIAMSKLAPALLAGNTMVLKPSPYTPLSTLQMGAVLNRALPPGVLNVISGGNALGRGITTHPAIRMISFTGSVPTGKKIAAAAAADLKRVSLELGGNDPAIVLDDADPDETAFRIFSGAFANCGQVCLAIKRVYVPESIFSRFVANMSELAQKAIVGDGLDPQTQIGPVNNLMQFEKVAGMVGEAKAKGAVIHTGGQRLGTKGYFYKPTIIVNVTDEDTIVAEEQFGPVIPILSYRTIDEVIERANNSMYGLGASVWSPDIDRATEVARRIEAGTVWINQHIVLSQKAPFGGMKWSGIGYSQGQWGIESFTQKQVLNIGHQ